MTYEIIGSAIEVHKIIGTELLENVYLLCMEEELKSRGINFETEKIIPVVYKEKVLKINFRCDLLVEKCVIVELKATNHFTDANASQVLNYMNLLKVPKGIIIIFNSSNIFHEGQKTFVNKYFKELPEK